MKIKKKIPVAIQCKLREIQSWWGGRWSSGLEKTWTTKVFYIKAYLIKIHDNYSSIYDKCNNLMMCELQNEVKNDEKAPWALWREMARQLRESFPFQQILAIYHHMLRIRWWWWWMLMVMMMDLYIQGLFKILEYVLSTRDHGLH